MSNYFLKALKVLKLFGSCIYRWKRSALLLVWLEIVHMLKRTSEDCLNLFINFNILIVDLDEFIFHVLEGVAHLLVGTFSYREKDFLWIFCRTFEIWNVELQRTKLRIFIRKIFLGLRHMLTIAYSLAISFSVNSSGAFINIYNTSYRIIFNAIRAWYLMEGHIVHLMTVDHV